MVQWYNGTLVSDMQEELGINKSATGCQTRRDSVCQICNLV